MNKLKFSFGIIRYINKKILNNKNQYRYSLSTVDKAPIIDSLKKENVKIEKKDILLFYNVITKKIKHYNFPYMHSNLKTLKLHPSHIKEPRFAKKRVCAYYNCLNNSITYKEKNKDSVLPHEFFHMSSTVKNEKNFSIFSGFSQSSISGNYRLIGLGLNEGYTQLLTERYFNVEKKSYPLETLIASRVEKIIGKEKMQIMYFNADLKGLINELLKYEDEKTIIKFIYNVDCFKILYSEFDIEREFLSIKKAYYYVIDFLLDVKFNKIIEESINFNKAKSEIIDFIKGFKDKAFVTNDYIMLLIEEEDYIKLLKKYIEKLMDFYISKRCCDEKTYLK